MKRPVVTTDALILNDKNEVLLAKREIDPFKGYWVLPGGHVEYKEKVEDALKREIKEELDKEIEIKKIAGILSAPNRDPRYHAITIVYLGKLKGKNEIKLNEEATEYKYFSLENLPANIGFDHRKIILKILKEKQ